MVAGAQGEVFQVSSPAGAAMAAAPIIHHQQEWSYIVCGLYGWSFRRPITRKKMRRLAWYLATWNDLRGGDSWGFYGTNGEYLRGVGEAYEGLRPYLPTIANCSHAIGHTRYATTGAVCAENAHPFSYKRWIGAHNGTVSNHAELNVRHQRDCAVDSEHLLRHVADGLPLREIEAYGALCLAEEGEHRIHLGIFNGGELAIAEVRHGVVWSSDERHLAMTLDQLSMAYTAVVIEEGQWYIAEDGELGNAYVDLDVSMPRYKRLWNASKAEDDAISDVDYAAALANVGYTPFDEFSNDER